MENEGKLIPFPILLAGEEHALLFDLDAQIGTTTTAKILGLGMQNITWWRFLDAPYDVGEIVVLLQQGINGAKRFNQEKKFLTTDDAKKLYQKHIEYIYKLASELEPDEGDEDGIDEKAMTFVQEENKKLWDALQAATRGGSGFRKSRKKPPVSA